MSGIVSGKTELAGPVEVLGLHFGEAREIANDVLEVSLGLVDFAAVGDIQRRRRLEISRLGEVGDCPIVVAALLVDEGSSVPVVGVRGIDLEGCIGVSKRSIGIAFGEPRPAAITEGV